MKIYIAGKISGQDLEKAKKKFAKAEKEMRQRGFETVNPLAIQKIHPDKSWGDYMLEDIKQLLRCDAILLLPDWEDSTGAKIEKMIAQKMGMRVIQPFKVTRQ